MSCTNQCLSTVSDQRFLSKQHSLIFILNSAFFRIFPADSISYLAVMVFSFITEWGIAGSPCFTILIVMSTGFTEYLIKATVCKLSKLIYIKLEHHGLQLYTRSPEVIYSIDTAFYVLIVFYNNQSVTFCVFLKICRSTAVIYMQSVRFLLMIRTYNFVIHNLHYWPFNICK